MISSSSNARVKFVRQLRDKKRARSENALFLVEGRREVERALHSGVACSFLVFYSPDIQTFVQNSRSSQPHLQISQALFEQLTVRGAHAEVLGVFHTPVVTLDDIKFKNSPLLLIVENLEKPGNLGALLRCAGGAGVDAIILTGNSVEVFNPNVIRTSLGTVFNVPCIETSNEEALAFCRNNQINCLAAAPAAELTYFDADLRGPTAIVLGSEATGLSSFWLDRCNGIALPMHGIADSLNLSATGAIVVYEAMRQRFRA